VGEIGDAIAMRLQRIDHAGETDAGQSRKHARMIAAHHAGAHHTDTKRTMRLEFSARPLGTHLIDPDNANQSTPTLSSTAPHMWRMPQTSPGHDLLQKITPANRMVCAIGAIGRAASCARFSPRLGCPQKQKEAVGATSFASPGVLRGGTRCGSGN